MPDLDHSLAEHLRARRPSYSFEFFPPKDDEGEEILWRTISELEPLDPTFVSVTYGAGGTSQERTVRITARIAEQTNMRAIGHLTLVAQSKGEIESVLKQYAAAGIDHVLALRGDPKGGPRAPWEPYPDGMNYAIDLVELAGDLGGFCVGVAAFPEGHPDADEHRRRRRGARREGRGRRRVRHHPAVLPVVRLLRPRRPRPRARTATSRSSRASCRS